MSVPTIDTAGPTETAATVESAAQRQANERASRSRDRFHRGTARWVVLVVISVAALLMLDPVRADAAQRVQVARPTTPPTAR